MNFKQRIMRRKEEIGVQYPRNERMIKEKENDERAKGDLFQYYCRVSQRRDAGEFQRNNNGSQVERQQLPEERTSRNQINGGKKQKSNYYDYDSNTPSVINQPVSQPYHISMHDSKRADEHLESKIQQNKAQIMDQIALLQENYKLTLQNDRKMIEQYMEKQNLKIQKLSEKTAGSRNQMIEGLNNIAKQVNSALETQQKKIRNVENQNKETIQNLKVEMNRSLNDHEEKIERLLMSNDGVKKSKNIGDYSMDLKSSIKQMLINNPVQLQENRLKKQLQQIQDNIKILKSDIMELKNLSLVAMPAVKSPSCQSFYQNKSEVEKELTKLSQKMGKMQKTLEHELSTREMKFGQIRSIAMIQEQNLRGMNDEFTKVINSQVIPRLKTLEDEFKNYSGGLQKTIQKHYSNKIEENLQKTKMIHIRKQRQHEKNKLEIEGVGYKESYMLDENHYLLDSSGTYLVNDKNERIQIQEDQLYFLKVQGIQIITPS